MIKYSLLEVETFKSMVIHSVKNTQAYYEESLITEWLMILIRNWDTLEYKDVYIKYILKLFNHDLIDPECDFYEDLYKLVSYGL